MDDPAAPPPVPTRGRRPCPICGKPTEPRFRPFCSSRCADIDLGRWFTERYRIPAGSADEEEEGPGPTAEDRR
jgi:endogenous inhibitor of DNA gyrase (YacG/DUF329 family)